MKNCKKILAVITAVLLVMVLSACAKTATIPAGKNTVGVKNGETVGQGATAFAVEVTDVEGNKTTFTVNTDEKMVGAALQALNLISGLRPVCQGGYRHHHRLREGRHLLGVLR